MFLDARLHPNASLFRVLFDGHDVTRDALAADTEEDGGWVEVWEQNVGEEMGVTAKRYGSVVLYRILPLSCPRCRAIHHDELTNPPSPHLEHECLNPNCGFSFVPESYPTLGAPGSYGQTNPPETDIFKQFGIDPDDIYTDTEPGDDGGDGDNDEEEDGS